MKTIITLLLVCITYIGFGKSKQAYEKLCEVNKCWAEQADINNLAYPECDNRTEREWIRTHLTLVEQTLRARSTAHLSEQQKANRLNALAHLNQYWHEGNFPVNDQYNYRTPIFIDKYDNFCAVGYLVKATGFEQVSRKIAATTNLAYVREMNYPELFAWANDYGFTVDELAWIQPGYPPDSWALPIGSGCDGSVHKLYTNKAGDKLFVGGNFSTVNSTISANNIAYVTGDMADFTWHSMGDGLNGTVYAIAEFDNKIFAAGNFTMSGTTPVMNIAYWDGTKWNAAGCINGTVKDLIVFKNELYAVGDFDVCAAMSEVNFSKWNGTVWTSTGMLDGHVNTVYDNGNELVLGGKFKYMGNDVNIIKWNATSGFTQYTSNIKNEVTDIASDSGHLYAVTLADIDTNELVMKLPASSNTWSALPQLNFTYTEKLGLNTICRMGSALFVGGDIKYQPQIQPSMPSSNCAVIYGGSQLGGYDGVMVDSAIYTMTLFKSRLVVGGKFIKGYSGSQSPSLNGIAIQITKTGIEGTFAEHDALIHIFPNPVKSGGEVIIENNIAAKHFRLYDVTGKLATDALIGTDNKVRLQQIPPGIYMAELSNINGEKAVSKLIIE